LQSYSWPGNVRELRNVIERAVLLGRNNLVTPDDLVLARTETQGWEWNLDHITLPPDGFDFEKLRRLERQLLEQALARTSNNQTQAARLLNLSRDRLRYRLQKHGLL